MTKSVAFAQNIKARLKNMYPAYGGGDWEGRSTTFLSLVTAYM